MLLKKGECVLVLVPEGEVLDTLLAAFQYLRLEIGIVRVPPIVSDAPDSQFLEQRSSFGRASILAIPTMGHAPGDQIARFEILGDFG